MHHSSPHQLYTSGALRLQQSNLPALDFFDNVDNAYGVDEDVLLTQINEETVAVPENRLNLTAENVDLYESAVYSALG